MWRPSRAGRMPYSTNYNDVPEPTVRFPNTSGHMGCVPPPASLTQPNAAGYSSLVAKEIERQKEAEYAALMAGGSKATAGKTGPRKRNIYDDEYLEKESDDEELAYQPAPDSPTAKNDSKSGDEDDPLDAFMAGVDKQAKADKDESLKKDKERNLKIEKGNFAEDEDSRKKGLGRADIDEEDMQESYFKFLEEKKTSAQDEEEEYEYDEDGNIIWTWKKVIDPLPSIDHSTIDYAPFNKNFYEEHEQIRAMTSLKAFELRSRLNLKVAGLNPQKPVSSFAHFGFDEALMNVIRKSEYEHPTAIQAQAVPSALSGRDVLGIAKTGSGKTVAYLWPAIVHIMDQPELKEGDGPIALIVVPTRELAIQVYQEAKRFCKVYNISTVCAYGGGSKWEQQNALKEGAELVVCTPGRIIDLVKIGATNFIRVTFLVFDEADRMFDMGFEAQVRSISNHIRPDRQCLMFSATFKSKVERLAREALNDPIRIVQGEIGEANADIVQTVEVLPNWEAKWRWILRHLVQFTSQGKVLIFVTKKQNAEDLAQRLRAKDFSLVLLHGDMLQAERNEKLQAFRKQIAIMVATDVAARGLDIPEIRTVINFDIARDIETHIHRIGRTGRAGEKGSAYTLVTEADKEMAGHLVRNLESVNQLVPNSLLQLALKSVWFKNSRLKGQSGGGSQHQRTGLGYKPRNRSNAGNSAMSNDTSRALSFTTVNTSKLNQSTALDLVKGADGTTNRLQAMKAAFKSSYAKTFHASSGNEWAESRAAATDPRPEWKKRLDEAAAAVNRQLVGGVSVSSAENKTDESSYLTSLDSSKGGPTFGSKKRSRWQ
uniref:RNA helicase n=1 Tax=Syphacia muris TaxID=451379 RepID=A0A0N5ADR4_9BILA